MRQGLMTSRFWIAAIAVTLAAALTVIVIQIRTGSDEVAQAVEPTVGEGLSPLSDRRVVTGWIPYYDLEEGVASVTSKPSVISEVSAFWYRATQKSQVRAMTGNWRPESDLTAAIDELHLSGVAVFATVKDDGFNGPMMWRLLSDADKRNKLVDSVVSMVERTGADGAEIDFEGMNFEGTAKQRTGIKRLFPVFLKRLQEELHRDDAVLAIALPARRSASDPNWEVIDYDAIGKVVDRARVMTYDYHVQEGNPGPIGPYAWTRDVMENARHQFRGVPLSIGTFAIGYNWYVRTLRGNCPDAVEGSTAPTHSQVLGLADDYNARILWSKDAREHHFDYRRPYPEHGRCVTLRRVWFGDARSAEERLRLANRLGIQGIVVWPLGYEDPRLWTRARSVAASINPAPAKIAISAPNSVLEGEPFDIAGRFSVSGTPLADIEAALQRRIPGRSWSTVDTVITGAAGRATVATSSQRTFEWRWRIAASWDWRQSFSPDTRVSVTQP